MSDVVILTFITMLLPSLILQCSIVCFYCMTVCLHEFCVIIKLHTVLTQTKNSAKEPDRTQHGLCLSWYSPRFKQVGKNYCILFVPSTFVEYWKIFRVRYSLKQPTSCHKHRIFASQCDHTHCQLATISSPVSLIGFAVTRGRTTCTAIHSSWNTSTPLCPSL